MIWRARTIDGTTDLVLLLELQGSLFRDSAPDTYRMVGRLPPDAPPPGPLDLPQVMLGLAGVAAGTDDGNGGD